MKRSFKPKKESPLKVVEPVQVVPGSMLDYGSFLNCSFTSSPTKTLEPPPAPKPQDCLQNLKLEQEKLLQEKRALEDDLAAIKLREA